MDPLTQVGAGKVDGILFALQCRKPKPKPRLVAFTGLAGSGKSTAAQVLIDAGWVRVKFADILKSMLQTYYEMCGLGRDEISRRKVTSRKSPTVTSEAVPPGTPCRPLVVNGAATS